MKKELILALRFTLVTTLVFGVIYPLAVMGLSKMLFPKQADGSLIERNGRTIGSKLIGQSFSSDKYFHPRPSAAGAGYDASASSPSNLAPTNQALIDRVKSDVARLQQENPGVPIPADLVTASGSGLDPEISPAAADFQIPRVAKARGISVDSLKSLVARHTQARTWGIFGEPRVNVLELNLDLDSLK
ncbi:MAG TPA: potassium-transporting ATPase subunit KdpC [Candidatus Sulfotelmatobacter sp.]|jgi:K+-transporting ATPase ATPase C chain|nr:potassium-transporting ATPase subunit KdpC [Candidatus Sulfotelmatobacter sp.]